MTTQLTTAGIAAKAAQAGVRELLLSPEELDADSIVDKRLAALIKDYRESYPEHLERKICEALTEAVRGRE